MKQSFYKIKSNCSLFPLRSFGGFLLWLLPLWLSAQTSTQNYIVTTVPYQSVSEPTNLTDANSNTSIQYFDGLGRPTETVQKAISGITGSDLVKLTEYDGVGREYRHWLPITSTGNGAYVTPSTITANTTTLYGIDGKPYTTTNYEPSPLNRVTGQYGAGASWYAGKKNDSILYQTNAGEVAYFFVNGSNQLQRTGSYAANTLYKTVMADEDGKLSTEYKDKLGHVVMKRSSGDVDTYYVYNDLGQLCYVIPPKAVDELTDFGDDNAIMKQYCYLYQYDERGNCIYKRLPGCTPIYMIYDKADRLVLSQNGNQRKQLQANLIQWSVTKYDSFGRAVFAGLMYRTEKDSTQNYKSIRDIISKVVITESYSDFSTATPLTISYYDNYSFIPSGNTLNYDSSQEQNGYTAYYSNAKGLLTGTRVYHLNDPNASETTALYYDKYGRMVQTRATNHLLGYDITYNKLDFRGKVTKSRKEHNISGQAVVPEVYRYAYDKAERLILTRYKLGANDTITLAANTYDELGRLRVKVLGGIDATTYSYNVRSWTTDIIGTRFSENLYYNANPLSSNVCFNGNIAGMQWDVPNEGIGHKRAYSFVYDNLNRLTNANYYGIYNGSVVAGTSDRYNETFTFDKMGNITNFVRNGLQSNNSTKIYSKVDDLVLEHVGNQLTRITDSGTNGSFYGDEEFFKNTNVNGNSCAYDANGNRLYDSNSNIWGIRYNLLNLPDAMQFYQGHQTNYTYSATGAKLKVIDKTAPPGAELPVTSLNTVLTTPSVSLITTTDYVGNMIYENGTLKRILTPVGYWQAGTYYYFLKDHLGSNRVVMTGSGGIAETSSYYPSGMRFGESSVILTNSIQPYRHTGHEMQEMHGLNWVDNLARFRTVSDGSGFTGMDPLAETDYNVTPYSYCRGNPINRIDPTGMTSTEEYMQEHGGAEAYERAYTAPEDNEENKDNSAQNQKQQTVDCLDALKNSYTGLYNQIQTCAAAFVDIFAKKKETTLPNGEKKISYEQRNWVPVYYGLSLTGSLVVGYGFKGSLNLGVMPCDGIFLTSTFGPAAGFDISSSAQLSIGLSNANTDHTLLNASNYSGLFKSVDGGMGLLSGSYSRGIIYTSAGSQYTNWNQYSGGLTIGSKSFLGGSIGTTLTSLPLYLYKFNNP